MTSLLRARYLRIAGLAAGAVAVAGAAIAITASAAGMNFGIHPAASSASPSPSPKPGTGRASTVCSDFMSHFATDVGKSQAQINAAFQKAIAETLADQVKSGQITQAQADAIKQKLANQTPCTLAAAAAPKGGGGTKPELGRYMQAYESAAAAALGITEAQLKTDLAGGQSLSQIAAAQNPPVTEDQFRTRLIANLKPALDTAVANKQLTAQQEQMVLNQLQTGPLPLWNAAPVKPRPATATPSPKAA